MTLARIRFGPQLDGVIEPGLARHPALVDEHRVVLQRELHPACGVRRRGCGEQRESEGEQAHAGDEGTGHLDV